jgi:hypothetical protein
MDTVDDIEEFLGTSATRTKLFTSVVASTPVHHKQTDQPSRPAPVASNTVTTLPVNARKRPTEISAGPLSQSSQSSVLEVNYENVSEEAGNDLDALPQLLHVLPLLERREELLVWKDCPFYMQGMVRIHTPADSNQIYHALLNACSLVYRDKGIDGMELKASHIVKMLRSDLAIAFGTPDVSGKRPYDRLLNGDIATFADGDPSKTFAFLQDQLLNAPFIPKVLMGFVSDAMAVDIYMVSAATRSVEPAVADVNELYKRRRSIVILYSNNHYELMGIKNQRGHITTLFKPDHPFISRLAEDLEA